MATFTVTTASDVVNAGDGVLSLREAVQQANATAAADTILFANALEGQTLTLTQGQITISSNMSIDGDKDDSGSRIEVNASGVVWAFATTGVGAVANLFDLDINGGNALEGDGGGILVGNDTSAVITGCTITGIGDPEQEPGEIANGIFAGSSSTVKILDSEISGTNGSGIWASSANISVQDSVITDNHALRGGGVNLFGGEARFENCVISNNGWNEQLPFYDESRGGGLYISYCNTSVVRTTISNNNAGYGGGGIFAKDSTVSLENSTIADNHAGASESRGGAIAFSSAYDHSGRLSITSSTITGNSIDPVEDLGNRGGAIYTAHLLTLSNSIVTGNFSGAYSSDIAGEITSSNGHNIFGSYVAGAQWSDLQNWSPTALFASIDPETGGGALALNGGPTPTVALRDALDNPALSGALVLTSGELDQRGIARPQPGESLPDIGAFELTQSALSTVPTDNNDVLTGTSAADLLDGLEGHDLLIGLGGNDTLAGGDGDDTLRGGFGNDFLFGDANSFDVNDQDTATYRDATAGMIVSLATGTSSGPLGADTLYGIENLDGGNFADQLTGDGESNKLVGLLGNDVLYGLTGNDRLYGGAGDDLLEGGFGDDWLDGGDGIDTVSYFNDTYPLAVTIDLFTNTVTRSGETDRLKDIENADGTNNADIITGNAGVNRLGGAGGNDTIRGLGADDILNGGAGNDVLDGDAGLDLADYAAGGAVVVDLSLATDTGKRGTETDTLREIEGAIGSPNADTFKGDGLANLFRGNAGKDTATGGAGPDVFDIDALAHSTVGTNRDVITDFTPGSDDLDLSTIDARSATPAVNDAFSFLAARGAAFTGAGQVRWYQTGGNTLVEANADANLAPDLQIQLTGLKTLSAADFVL